MPRNFDRKCRSILVVRSFSVLLWVAPSVQYILILLTQMDECYWSAHPWSMLSLLSTTPWTFGFSFTMKTVAKEMIAELCCLEFSDEEYLLLSNSLFVDLLTLTLKRPFLWKLLLLPFNTGSEFLKAVISEHGRFFIMFLKRDKSRN